MALNIYIGTIPKEKEHLFIKDVDAFFEAVDLRDDEYTHLVLSEVEQGIYRSAKSFVDRFGEGLRTTHLSTGSKILLAVNYYPEYIFNGCELGGNGYEVLTQCRKGSIYFRTICQDFYNDFVDGCTVNGEACSDIEEVNYLLSIGEV